VDTLDAFRCAGVGGRKATSRNVSELDERIGDFGNNPESLLEQTAFLGIDPGNPVH